MNNNNLAPAPGPFGNLPSGSPQSLKSLGMESMSEESLLYERYQLELGRIMQLALYLEADARNKTACRASKAIKSFMMASDNLVQYLQSQNICLHNREFQHSIINKVLNISKS
jgi:hypothetical protein